MTFAKFYQVIRTFDVAVISKCDFRLFTPNYQNRTDVERVFGTKSPENLAYSCRNELASATVQRRSQWRRKKMMSRTMRRRMTRMMRTTRRTKRIFFAKMLKMTKYTSMPNLVRLAQWEQFSECMHTTYYYYIVLPVII